VEPNLSVTIFVLPSNLDWDKCRSLCPVAKPSPPTLPGAQLTLDVPDPGSDITVDHKVTILPTFYKQHFLNWCAFRSSSQFHDFVKMKLSRKLLVTCWWNWLKELRQLWEDELITYKCYNESLILDHQASGKSVIQRMWWHNNNFASRANWGQFH